MRKNNKKAIIISISVAVVVIACIMACLYLETDIFKSKQELFAKYFTQEIENLQKMLDLETIKTYGNLENANKWEGNVAAGILHSEGGEISNPLNNLSAKISIQKDEEQQYFYGNGQILYEDEKYLETQIIKEQQKYGIRLPDATKQFIIIEDDENLETIVNEIGIDVSKLKEVVGKTEKVISQDNINIIKTEIANGTFEKQKNALITYNGVTTETNAYSVLLTGEQVKTILLQILDEIDEEKEIADAKIIVYVQNKNTIRTIIEIGTDKIIIENAEQEGLKKCKFNYSTIVNEEILEYNFEIIKFNAEGQENIEIIATLPKEEDGTISIVSEMRNINDNIELDLKLEYKKDITTISLQLENQVKVNNDFEKMQVLEQGNYVSLSSVKNVEKRTSIINSIKDIILQKVTEHITRLGNKLFPISEPDEKNEEQVGMDVASQVEINQFNAKFEFYVGNEVTTENVKSLLNIVKNHLGTYEITEIQSEQNANSVIPEKSKISIKLGIQQNVTNENAINDILGKMTDNTKYKVSIFYRSDNNLIDYITITEI